MRKIYHLSTCDTCQRIIKQLKLQDLGFEMQDIKLQNIGPDQLDELKEKVGSYEALFSKRALKFKAMGLDKMDLSEADLRRYILEEYTFLKRPVIWVDDEVFVGNAQKTIEAVAAKLR
jgi:arsenate reductase